MRIIKVDAIESTNLFLRNLYRSQVVHELTGVSARHQIAGRGQKGTTWQSDAGKNVTCSILVPKLELPVQDQFMISMVTSLLLLEILEAEQLPNLAVKWPNDILSDTFKIAGILIENVVIKNTITATIIGIGLNVNQNTFNHLPKASSLHIITGQKYDPEQLFLAIADAFQTKFLAYLNDSFQHVKNMYENYLFKKDKAATFKKEENILFSGIIQGVNRAGQVEILTENDAIERFDLKEVTLLY
ncbi:biotin--[acetyl-CoA-carboxylase] ligase [Aquimarina sp. ERC-38]|uniref:biotin--[acetyl-CoA-carboxylase] ligase n=1 Tax=Aquimarina sp. ERC-38 TaxID=2949996 RepID=UPI0022470F30|nr:biotin--[acetyl-CoA-carboxylase] ligase [Aquimarina sp. ERC-38]UZO80557.1 biotin--[acetyl-CoA-carboxylase] ligase [Aquimarina sp. ERC-38]